MRRWNSPKNEQQRVRDRTYINENVLLFWVRAVFPEEDRREVDFLTVEGLLAEVDRFDPARPRQSRVSLPARRRGGGRLERTLRRV